MQDRLRAPCGGPRSRRSKSPIQRMIENIMERAKKNASPPFLEKTSPLSSRKDATSSQVIDDLLERGKKKNKLMELVIKGIPRLEKGERPSLRA